MDRKKDHISLMFLFPLFTFTFTVAGLTIYLAIIIGIIGFLTALNLIFLKKNVKSNVICLGLILIIQLFQLYIFVSV
ncbi:hypothetical protein Q7A53_15645 [Halobacillus rhizosphaerae]|uniref:hypothetical protein n=1 Tax=Halobacillus rhizosphaerae TaxID=3064889 RepID=UPI00398AEFF5